MREKITPNEMPNSDCILKRLKRAKMLAKYAFMLIRYISTTALPELPDA